MITSDVVQKGSTSGLYLTFRCFAISVETTCWHDSVPLWGMYFYTVSAVSVRSRLMSWMRNILMCSIFNVSKVSLSQLEIYIHREFQNIKCRRPKTRPHQLRLLFASDISVSDVSGGDCVLEKGKRDSKLIIFSTVLQTVIWIHMVVPVQLSSEGT